MWSIFSFPIYSNFHVSPCSIAIVCSQLPTMQTFHKLLSAILFSRLSRDLLSMLRRRAMCLIIDYVQLLYMNGYKYVQMQKRFIVCLEVYKLRFRVCNRIFQQGIISGWVCLLNFHRILCCANNSLLITIVKDKDAVYVW